MRVVDGPDGTEGYRRPTRSAVLVASLEVVWFLSCFVLVTVTEKKTIVARWLARPVEGHREPRDVLLRDILPLSQPTSCRLR